MANDILVVEQRPARGVLFPSNSGAGPRSFGITVQGGALEPFFFDGDAAIIDPDQKPFSGDWVLLATKRGRTFIARMFTPLLWWPVSEANGDCSWTVDFEQTNPPRRFSIQAQDLHGVCRVLGKGIRED